MKQIFAVALLVMGVSQIYGWGYNPHKRLAQKILDYPPIAQIVEDAGLDRNKIVEFCERGDHRLAHDWYSGFNTIKNWNSFKQTYLNDAVNAPVIKERPDEFKVEVTYTYWVSYSRQAYTQNVQDTSINLSIGRGLDVLANTLETVLV